MACRRLRLSTAPLVRQVATNPVILATIFGLLWSILGSPLPRPVASILTMLGEALTPCALFAIGLDLTLTELRERLGLYALLTALKLAVMPLVVYALCVATELDRTATIAAVVCAAVPAVEYDVEKTVVGAVISMSTLFSVITLPGCLYVL